MATDRAAAARDGAGGTASRPFYAEIGDPGSLARFGEEIKAANPSDWPGYPEQLGRARTVTGARHVASQAPGPRSGG
jgi:hypothetical protein